MSRDAAYYRARNLVITSWIDSSLYFVDKEATEIDKRLLRYGFIPEKYLDILEIAIEQYILKKKIRNDELYFPELTKFNTWFVMHPEKIAGNEFASTSIHFPVMIKGSRQQIIETIRAGMRRPIPTDKIERAKVLREKLKRFKEL